MRRLLTACAVTVLSLAALGLAVFALGIQVPSVLAGAPAEVWQSAVAIIAPAAPATQSIAKAPTPAKAIVVAQGVIARTVAHDEQNSLYLTAVASPNRVLALENLPAAAAANTDAAVSSSENAAAVARIVPFAGTGQLGSLGDNGTALLAQFNLKTDSVVMRSGVAVAADGSIFLADTLNATIRRISGPRSSEPGIVRAIAGRWASNESALLVEPTGVAVDRAGNLYIADHAAGAIYVVRAATSNSPAAPEIFAHVVSPGSVAVTPDGSMVFAASPDTGAVFAIATKSHSINAISGFELSAVRASASSTSSKAAGSYCGVTAETAPEACPAGLAVDGKGNLFISDATLGKIFRVDAKTGASKVAATGIYVPGDMSFDNAGNLFVSEQGSENILEFEGMGAPLSALTISVPAPLPPPTAPEICNALQVQPEAYNFCNEPVDGTTASQTFTLTNNSGATANTLALSITPLTTPSNFTITSSTCTASLAAGASCLINVAFTPQQTGEDDASLTATDVGGDTVSTELGGTGTDYQLALATGQTTQLNVEQGQAVTFMLQLIPDNNFSGNVTFVCPPAATNKATSNGFVPPYTSCTINPPTSVVSPGTPVPFSVTFQTTYNFIPPVVTAGLPAMPFGSGGNHPRATVSSGIVRAFAFPALAMAALLGIFFVARRGKISPSRATRSRTWLSGLRAQIPAMSLAAVLLGLALLGACHKYKLNPAAETTPAGDATMTLTATSQGVSRGVTFTLEVVPYTPTLPGDRPGSSAVGH